MSICNDYQTIGQGDKCVNCGGGAPSHHYHGAFITGRGQEVKPEPARISVPLVDSDPETALLHALVYVVEYFRVSHLVAGEPTVTDLGKDRAALDRITAYIHDRYKA